MTNPAQQYPKCERLRLRDWRPFGVAVRWLPWVLAVWLLAPAALASVELRRLSLEERQALEKGHAVERRFELPHKGAKYLAAVSYALLDKPCSQLTSLLKEPARHLAKALPATREVQFVSQHGDIIKLRIIHGNSVMQGAWSALYRAAEDGRTARFWLDTDAERDVEDVFGYFRLSSWKTNACLVTAAVAVDPGDGLLASLFRSTIHDYLVRSAARIQRYVRTSNQNFAFLTTGVAQVSSDSPLELAGK